MSLHHARPGLNLKGGANLIPLSYKPRLTVLCRKLLPLPELPLTQERP